MPWILLVCVLWALLVLLGHWLRRAPIRGRDDLAASGVYRVFQVYARVVHRLRVGAPSRPPRRDSPDPSRRPLIVVANHTAGVDPVLVQAAVPFEIRWMMAEDMRLPAFEGFWRFGRVIFVDRRQRSSKGVREALRELRAGGVIGVFAEGHLERPPRAILPFQTGVGMLVRKSGARVLPAVIDGTPQVDPAWASLWTPSHARVRFLPIVDYAETDLDARGIADDLRARFLDATGWPANDNPPRLDEHGRWVLTTVEGREYRAAAPETEINTDSDA
jgi:1-acyl-sn-glycerol-3-phosphate acyltransferase